MWLTHVFIDESTLKQSRMLIPLLKALIHVFVHWKNICLLYPPTLERDHIANFPSWLRILYKTLCTCTVSKDDFMHVHELIAIFHLFEDEGFSLLYCCRFTIHFCLDLVSGPVNLVAVTLVAVVGVRQRMCMSKHWRISGFSGWR